MDTICCATRCGAGLHGTDTETSEETSAASYADDRIAALANPA